jgi:hypothetical protein
MASPLVPANTSGSKGGAMSVWAIVATVFVLGVLAFIAYGVFEVTPFARNSNRFRDSTGRRSGESPHLETRDEYEHTHPT